VSDFGTAFSSATHVRPPYVAPPKQTLSQDINDRDWAVSEDEF
jgi:hypothetical protein